MHVTIPAPPLSLRYDRLDALRGVAMVWMTVYHFCFDLNYFKWIKQDFYRDPVWTWQRTCIVSLFLLCAGAGQAVALHQGQSWQRFWRRWAQVALCALLVTAGSYLMYPRSFIFFGVLHGIAVMLVIVRLTAHWGRWLWLTGALAIAISFIAAPAIFHWPGLQYLNEKAFSWLGLVSSKPLTEDYVPLLPWLGVMWWGVATAQWLLRTRPALLTAAIPSGARSLAWLGGWSLVYYMLHQPVLLALLSLVQRFR
jgi:uncharacterized membrane protein